MSLRFKTGSGAPPSGLSLPVETSGNVLPPFVHDYLRDGAPEGGRNEAIFKVAQQFLWCGLPESEAVSRIMPVAVSQGGAGVAREVERAIASAYKSAPREPLEAGHRGELASAPVRPSGWDATMRGLRAAFGESELVGIVPAKWDEKAQDWFPTKAIVHTVKAWTKRGSVLSASDGGAWICINPLKSDAEGASAANVAAFRHVLVEFDDPNKTAVEQEAAIREAGFPVSAMVSSGGRSVHAWVKVDAKDEVEWNARREKVWAAVPGCDQKVKGEARLSRLPGFMRGEKEQKLLAVNIGAKSWAAWEAKGAWTPDSWGVLELVERGPEPPPEVICGVLRRGCHFQLSSGPKMRKSYTLLDLSLSVATGSPWLGLETVKGPVFYADAENQLSLIRQRIPAVVKSRGFKLTPEINDMLRFSPLRGQLRGKTLAEIVAGVVRSIRAMLILFHLLIYRFQSVGKMSSNH